MTKLTRRKEIHYTRTYVDNGTEKFSTNEPRKSEILIPPAMNIAVVLDVMPCSLVEGCLHFVQRTVICTVP